MVRILVLSFLFKWESFSFVRGLWLLDLINRNFLVDIFWIPFASGILRWWLESLLLPSIREIVVRSIFFGNLCLVYKRTTSAWAFLQGDRNSLGLSSFFIREFSLVLWWPMISSCYFFAAYSFFLMSQQIWYGRHLLHRSEGALTSSGKYWT